MNCGSMAICVLIYSRGVPVPPTQLSHLHTFWTAARQKVAPYLSGTSPPTSSFCALLRCFRLGCAGVWLRGTLCCFDSDCLVSMMICWQLSFCTAEQLLSPAYVCCASCFGNCGRCPLLFSALLSVSGWLSLCGCRWTAGSCRGSLSPLFVCICAVMHTSVLARSEGKVRIVISAGRSYIVF